MRIYSNPDARTVLEMLLAEPHSVVLGPLEDVCSILYEVTWRLLMAEGMTDDQADALARRHLVRAHTALADAGLVVRQVSGE